MTTQIIVSHVQHVLSGKGVKFPYDLQIWRDGPQEWSKSEWDAYQWNPPQYGEYTDPDTSASPKPTWEEMVFGQRQYDLIAQKFAHGYAIPTLSQHRTALTDAATIEHDGESLYVGAGLDHMTGLLQMVEQANDAGERIPHIAMRDGDHNVKYIYRGSQVREILKTTALRENAVESSHNVIMAEYHAQARIRDDDTQSLDDREAAATAAQNILDNYQTKLQAEVDKNIYTRSRFPPSDDLEETKKYIIEDLEAEALGKIKDLQGYVTTQGMMLPPTCFDQGAAVEKVAVELQKAVIKINKLQKIFYGPRGSAIPSIYTDWGDALNAIKAVEILNTPVFKINQLLPSDDPYPLDKLLVAADHPPGEDIPGEVDIIEIKLTKGKLLNGFPKYHTTSGKTKHEAEIQIDKTQEARIVVRARNVCGVSRLIINMKPV